jgi:hypothetical protein
MTGHENQTLNQPTAESEPRTGPRRRLGGLFSWWLVWLPVIVVVILWIGGWGFGDYGGPWSPRPRNVEPKISDPGVAKLEFNDPAILWDQGTFSFRDFSLPS